MVAVAQLVEPRLVVPVVAGSSPVSHPRWVRCEPATKGPPLATGPAWLFFFESATNCAHACSVVAIAGHAEPLDDLVQGGVVLFGAAIPLSRRPRA